jgi:hypothetical protein
MGLTVSVITDIVKPIEQHLQICAIISEHSIARRGSSQLRKKSFCPSNCCRSQMAEGVVNHDLGDTFQAFLRYTKLCLTVLDPVILTRLRRDKSLQNFCQAEIADGFLLAADERGNIKQAMIKIGYHVQDLC